MTLRRLAPLAATLATFAWGCADRSRELTARPATDRIVDLDTGASLPARRLPGWRRVFADDFATPVRLGEFSGCSWPHGLPIARARCAGLPASVRRKWFSYGEGWRDTSGHGTYAPARVISIRHGMMNLHLHGGYVAAPVPRVPGARDGDLRYGRYVVRFRADPVPGYKTAWLLWPDRERRWRDSETDFPEGDLDGTIGAFAHYEAHGSARQDAFETSAGYASWHTAIIEWTPRYRRFVLDGRIVGTSRQPVPRAMHWVLQTETSLTGPPPAPDAVGDLQIDWVAVYTRAKR